MTTFAEAARRIAEAKGLTLEVQVFDNEKLLAARLREIADMMEGGVMELTLANAAFWFDTEKGAPLLRLIGFQIQVRDKRGPTIQ